MFIGHQTNTNAREHVYMSICAALKAHPMHVKCTTLQGGRRAVVSGNQQQSGSLGLYREADECNTPVNPNTSQLFAMHLLAL